MWKKLNARRQPPGGAARPFLIRGLLVTLVVLLSVPLVAAEPKLTAKLDRGTISLGETATLSLIFENVFPNAAPGLPALAGLQLVGTSSSQSFSFINGERSQSITYDFTLMPGREGEFTIPRMDINVRGTTLATQPLKLKVLKAGSAIPNSSGENPVPFMKLVVAKTNLYVGELLPVEIQLFALEGHIVQVPQLAGEGFSVGKMSQPSQSQSYVGNQLYGTATYKFYVVPAKTGALTLGPASLLLSVPDLRYRPNIFGDRPRQQLTVTSNPQALQILPLPAENVPATFSGAVGSYTMSFDAGPAEVAVGDPVTLKIRIVGRGLLDALTLPGQPDWREFKFYQPNSKVEYNDALGVSGFKLFEQVVIPQNSEIKSVPPFVFSFFDPDQRQYRTLTSAAIPLLVRPGGATPSVPSNFTNAGAATAPPPPQDIVHIKPHLGQIAPIAPPLLLQKWFLGLQAVPVGLWLFLLVRRKYLEARANNPLLRRQKQVTQIIKTGWRNLREFASSNQPEQFFATLFRLLQEQVGERLDLPASAITEAVIDERLRGRNLAGETLTALHELFQACNMARYARHSSQELSSLVPKLEQVLRELQKVGQ